MGKFSVLAALGVLALLKVAHAMPQSGSDPSLEESAENSGIFEELRTLCRNNSGSDEAYVALAEAVQTALMCANTTVDLKTFISDIDTLSNETRTTFFSKYCPQLKTAGSCLDDVLKAGKPCFKEHGFTNVVAVAGMYPDALDLLCKNDGEIIFKLSEPKYEQCINTLRDNVEECTVPFGMECKHWNFSNLTETQLGSFSGLRQCVEDKLNDCEAPKLISVYDLFHNTLFHLASCRNVCPFLENAFVSSVLYLSTETANETSTVDED